MGVVDIFLLIFLAIVVLVGIGGFILANRSDVTKE